MAQADWTELTNNLDTATIDRGTTTGIPRPNGGGSFVYGFNSLAITPGGAGLFCSIAGFAPMAKGGSIRGAVQRGISGGPLNFTPFLFIGATGPDLAADKAYILGLQDDDPHRIVLRKGTLNGGIPAGAPGTQGILRRSTATYAPGVWHHLRLDMIANTNGDVILTAFRNDLLVHPVTAPVWTRIPGMAANDTDVFDFVDDALGVNTGAAPFTSGRVGYCFVSKDVTRRGFFDHLEVMKQT